MLHDKLAARRNAHIEVTSRALPLSGAEHTWVLAGRPVMLLVMKLTTDVLVAPTAMYW